MPKIPSPEQQEAIDYQGNEVITARPGSGKTFTISRIIRHESESLLSYQGIIAISFTNKASDELEERCGQLGVRSVRSFFGTIDKFCLGEVIVPFASRLTGTSCDFKVIDKQDIDGDCARLCDGLFSPQRTERQDAAYNLLSGGMLPITALGRLALEILDVSPDANRYLTARYTSVFVDEYQDCGPDQHELFMHLAGLGIRAVAVGDVDQAIFGFAGKRSDYLIGLLSDERFKHFDLTENRRCHLSIIDYSLRLLGRPVQRPLAQDRRVFRVDIEGDESAIASAIEAYLPRIREKYSVLHNNEVALLFRGNATLNRYDTALSSFNLPTKIHGDTPLDRGIGPWRRLLHDLLCAYYSRDQYPGALLERYLGGEVKSVDAFRAFDLLERFFKLTETELAGNLSLVCEIARLCCGAPREDAKADIASYVETVSDLTLLRSGFRPAQPQEVNLMTYYKAKGLEFDIVFCLECYEYIMPPYRYKQCSYDAFSEMLAAHYVGITRAKKACYIPIGTARHNKHGNLLEARASEFLFQNGLSGLRHNVRCHVS